MIRHCIICLPLTCADDGVPWSHRLRQFVSLGIDTPAYQSVTTALACLKLTGDRGALRYITLSLTLIHDEQFCQHTLLQAGSHIQGLTAASSIVTTGTTFLHGRTLQVVLAAHVTLLGRAMLGAGARLLQLERCWAAHPVVVTCNQNLTSQSCPPCTLMGCALCQLTHLSPRDIQIVVDILVSQEMSHRGKGVDCR
jgi:hypothetical protein